MNCCFLFTTHWLMDVPDSDIKSTLSDSRIMRQELSKTITESVKNSQNPLELAPSYSLLPELKTDEDIENVLHKISELLHSQSGNNSLTTDLNDSRSIEDILKEAEEIVKQNSAYFDKSVRSKHTSSPNHLIINPRRSHEDKSDRTDCSVELDVEKNSPSKDFLDEWENDEPSGTKRVKESPLTVGDLQTSPVVLSRKNSGLNSLPALNSSSLLAVNSDETLAMSEPCKTQEKVRSVEADPCKTPEVHSDLSEPSRASDKMYISTPPRKSSIGESTSFSGMKNGNISTSRSTKSSPKVNNNDFEKIKRIYEEKIFDLERQVNILNAKIVEYEKDNRNNIIQEDSNYRMKLLEQEIKTQEELLEGYQRENQKLLADTAKAKKAWNEAEAALRQKIRKLEMELKRSNQLNNTEVLELRDKLSDSKEELLHLEEEAIKLRIDKREFEKKTLGYECEVKLLRNEIDRYKKEIELSRQRERSKEKAAQQEAGITSAALQTKLTQSNTDLTKKQAEVVKLSGEVTRLRGELERARLGSVLGDHPHSASQQVRQLELALTQERENTRQVSSQLESLTSMNSDLNRQVKELEFIVKKRSKGGGLPWGDMESSEKRMLEQKNKQLETMLMAKEKLIADNQQKLNEIQNKLEKEDKAEKLSKSGSLNSPLSSSRIATGRKTPQAAASDSHLMATIRGLKAEIANKDKLVTKLSRELEDTKKKPKTTLQKQLNNRHQNSVKSSDKAASVVSSTESATPSKNYNPFAFEEDQEAIVFLRNENHNLRMEVKKLEQDLISLHNKRIQDLSQLEANHSHEMTRAVREQASRQSNSQLSHLKGQIYTQQMVINHLKSQIKTFEERNQEMSMIKAERDHLQGALVEANKKVATLHQLSSPENSDYGSLLEKLEMLERRHEMREAKLQAIVKQLAARQQTSNVCNSESCKDKLYNKNREICYYRAEIDKILDTLSEFKYK